MRMNYIYIYTFMFIVGNHNAIVTIPIFFGADEVGIARFSWNDLEHSPLLFLIYKWGPFMALWIPHGSHMVGIRMEWVRNTRASFSELPSKCFWYYMMESKLEGMCP